VPLQRVRSPRTQLQWPWLPLLTHCTPQPPAPCSRAVWLLPQPPERHQDPGADDPARTWFSELETSKGGSDIIDCLRRAHRTALSLDLLGISHTQTGLESRPAALSEGTVQGLASNEEESPEARHFGYGHIDIGSWWTPKVSRCKCARGMRELARGD
jgi:hypothetical protein